MKLVYSIEKKTLKHIFGKQWKVAFFKTKQTYATYKKTGYNRDFKEQHITEILLHQAAKNYFKELGLPKLPKMQDLKNEYAIWVAEKKKTYGKYSALRTESQEISNAKQNVECILDIDKTPPPQEEKCTDKSL